MLNIENTEIQIDEIVTFHDGKIYPLNPLLDITVLFRVIAKDFIEIPEEKSSLEDD